MSVKFAQWSSFCWLILYNYYAFNGTVKLYNLVNNILTRVW